MRLSPALALLALGTAFTAPGCQTRDAAAPYDVDVVRDNGGPSAGGIRFDRPARAPADRTRPRPRRDGAGIAPPPAYGCTTVRHGPDGGTSTRCTQGSDEVITRSADRGIRDRVVHDRSDADPVPDGDDG